MNTIGDVRQCLANAATTISPTRGEGGRLLPYRAAEVALRCRSTKRFVSGGCVNSGSWEMVIRAPSRKLFGRRDLQILVDTDVSHGIGGDVITPPAF